MRKPFTWMSRSIGRSLRRNRLAITLHGLEPFLFETHGPRDGYVSHTIHSEGVWEPATTALLLQLLRNDVDVIDVGANIGWYSVTAGHRLGTRGQVHSFEPERRNLGKLRINVALSGLANVVVNAWALSDGNRPDVLSLSGDNLGDHWLGPAPAGTRRRAVSVDVRRLDDYAGIRNRPLVIKLDVQGSEWHVLRGSQQLLGSHPHEIVLLCEMDPVLLEERGSSLDDLGGLLAANGFAAAVVDQRTGSIEPTGWPRLTDRLNEGRRNQPRLALDIVAFRRFDGLMRTVFTR